MALAEHVLVPWGEEVSMGLAEAEQDLVHSDGCS